MAGAQRAGVAWYIVNPATPKVLLSGYLGANGHDFTYPAIGATASGRGVMAFTDTGDSTYPSAAYAPIDAIVGVGAWNDVPGGLGAAADDGFSGYQQQNFRTRSVRAGATTARRRSMATRSGSPASTSPTPATTPTGAARSSPAAPATTCSARALARATARARGPRSLTGRRGSAS